MHTVGALGATPCWPSARCDRSRAHGLCRGARPAPDARPCDARGSDPTRTAHHSLDACKGAALTLAWAADLAFVKSRTCCAAEAFASTKNQARAERNEKARGDRSRSGLRCAAGGLLQRKQNYHPNFSLLLADFAIRVTTPCLRRSEARRCSLRKAWTKACAWSSRRYSVATEPQPARIALSW